MKKTILLTSLLCISLASFGQKKKQEYAGWYDYTNASINAGITYDTILTTLFPDSTLISTIADDSGNILIGNTNLHSIGQVFDPKYEFFNDPGAATGFNSFVVDSIELIYKYNHAIDSSVDTLKIQFYQNAQVKTVTLFPSEEVSYSVQYSWQINQSYSPNFSREIQLLLDSSNDTKGEYKAMQIAIPNGGLRINSNNLCAYTLSYSPGFSYNQGDTVDMMLQPMKELNQFSPLILTDRNKFSIYNGNIGLFINTTSRYNLPDTNWQNIYISGHGYRKENRHLGTSFYAQIIGSVPSLASLTTLSIYPNPITNTQQLNIDFELTKQEDLSFTITDITGRIVKEIDIQTYQQGQHNLKADLTGLSAGMYYVNIISTEGGRTTKPIVIS